jgi:glycosyltransferase involved in cell wall biosynthesis
MNRQRVNLVGAPADTGGIARYRLGLERALAPWVDFIPAEVGAGALSGRPLLRQMPLAVHGLDPTVPAHFVQIVGAGVLWLRRLPPSVVTAHDLGPLVWPTEWLEYSPFARTLLMLAFTALRRAQRVISVSEASARTLVERLRVDPARVRVVLRSIDHAVFHPRAAARRHVEERLGIGRWDEWRTIVNVGTELPRKNLAVILGALRILQRQGARVRLLKVGGAGGDQWRAATVRAAAQLGVEDRVRFVRFESDDDLAALYSAADAYVCVSHVEGFSLPTVEAMACGAPTIVAPNGALPEVVGDAGVVLDDGSAERLAGALGTLFADPARAERLRALGPVQARKFAADREAEQTLTVYRELAALC